MAVLILSLCLLGVSFKINVARTIVPGPPLFSKGGQSVFESKTTRTWVLAQKEFLRDTCCILLLLAITLHLGVQHYEIWFQIYSMKYIGVTPAAKSISIFELHLISHLSPQWKSCPPWSDHVSKEALSARSIAAFLLGQTMEGQTALDLALSQGNVALVRALGRMGCDISSGQIKEERAILERILYGGLPHWLVRTVGALAHSGSLVDDGIVLENPEDIRNYTQKETCQTMANRVPVLAS